MKKKVWKKLAIKVLEAILYILLGAGGATTLS